MKTWKVLLAVATVVVLVLVGLGVKTFYDAGEFKTMVPHFKGQCQAITGVFSSEDITIDPQSGLAFISSDDRRPWFNGAQGKQGAIMGYDVKHKTGPLVNLTGEFAREFHPHGIGLFKSPDGKSRLFVVNHTQKGHFVEIFDVEAGRLIHRESISSPLMHNPNDVIPVGPRAFYVTNDHGSASRWGKTLEDYLQLSRSYVLYYDGKDFRKVADGLSYANGINKSADGKTLYVAATVAHTLHLYDRDVTSGGLTSRGSIDLGTGIDNIEVDEGGDLWIGAHPKLLTFVKYSKDPSVPSPSQVLRVKVQKDGSAKAEEVYLNSGTPMSGSSVAAVFSRSLLIGSVFDDRFLVCGMP